MEILATCSPFGGRRIIHLRLEEGVWGGVLMKTYMGGDTFAFPEGSGAKWNYCKTFLTSFKYI